MKKLFAIAVMMMLGMANTFAQVDGTFQFIDANDNVVADGSTVNVSAEITPGMPEFGIPDELYAKFGLFVKNTTKEEAYVAVNLVTEEMPNGYVQICFPITCQTANSNNYTTNAGPLLANEKKDLQTEWFPEIGSYGKAHFTVQLLVMDRFGMFPNYSYEKVADGPKVTVNCVYSDPAGISNLESDKNATVVARYNAKGQVVTAPVKGVNILKLSNGKTVKQIIK